MAANNGRFKNLTLENKIKLHHTKETNKYTLNRNLYLLSWTCQVWNTSHWLGFQDEADPSRLVTPPPSPTPPASLRDRTTMRRRPSQATGTRPGTADGWRGRGSPCTAGTPSGRWTVWWTCYRVRTSLRWMQGGLRQLGPLVLFPLEWCLPSCTRYCCWCGVDTPRPCMVRIVHYLH